MYNTELSLWAWVGKFLLFQSVTSRYCSCAVRASHAPSLAFSSISLSAEANRPAIYTRVSGYSEWITLNICKISDDPPATCAPLYPSYVQTQVETDGKICSGTLIHSDIVLTSAQCATFFTGNNVIIGSGLRQEEGFGTETIGVAMEIIHPDYNPLTNENDIMILKLSSPSSLTPTTVSSGFLPENLPELPENLPEDESLVILGFDYVDSGGNFERDAVLNDIVYEAVDFADCTTNGGFPDLFPDTQVCAKIVDQDDGKYGSFSNCQGGLGSGVINPVTNVLYGITTAPVLCDTPDTPTRLTRVSAFDDFIRTTVCEMSDNPPADCVEDLLPGDFPFFVHTEDGSLCSGTLINADIVLTSALCAGAFSGSNVIIGSSILGDGEGVETIRVDGVFTHPDFDPDTQENDIALVRLAVASVAPLVALNTDEALPTGNEETRIIGFQFIDDDGNAQMSDILIEFLFTTVDFADCEASLDSDLFPDTQLCVKSAEDPFSCQGDLGSPLLAGDSDVQLGIASYNVGCDLDNGPTIITRVSAYADFIRLTVCQVSVFAPPGCPTPSVQPTNSPAPSAEPSTSVAPTTSAAPSMASIAPSAIGGTEAPTPGEKKGNGKRKGKGKSKRKGKGKGKGMGMGMGMGKGKPQMKRWRMMGMRTQGVFGN
jgi:trypsin